MASSCQLIGYQENTEFTGIFLGFLILCSLTKELRWTIVPWNCCQISVNVALLQYQPNCKACFENRQITSITHRKNSLVKLLQKKLVKKPLRIKLVEKSLNKFVGKNTLEKTRLKKLVGIKFVRIKFSENLIKSTCIILDSSTQGSSRLKKKDPGNFNLISVYLNIV